MSSSDPRIYLLHIRDCCEELAQCAALRGQRSVPVSILFSAVCRNLEIIGEASRKVGADFRAAHPAVPWREMNDLRNVLIHPRRRATNVTPLSGERRKLPGRGKKALQPLAEERIGLVIAAESLAEPMPPAGQIPSPG